MANCGNCAECRKENDKLVCNSYESDSFGEEVKESDFCYDWEKKDE